MDDCGVHKIPSGSPPTRQLLVGKQRHAPPAPMMLPQSVFPDSGGIMLSGVAELSVFSLQVEIRPKRNVATRLLA
jgi:hypothetical protein